MKYSGFGIVCFLLSPWIVETQNATNLTSNALAKTKRNLSRDIQSYGESSVVLPYASNTKVFYEPKALPSYYQARPLALVDFSEPVKVVEPKVAAEQVLYEFQQTPTDSVSNVHVKQLFQPNLKPLPQLANTSPGVITSESVATPVQQPPFTQNQVQSFNIKQHPLYSVQPTYFEPKKYVYGKIIVDSTLPHPQTQPHPHHFPQTPTAFHSNQHFPAAQGIQFAHGKPIINYQNQFPRNNILAHVEQPPPVNQNKFRPPPKNLHQQIDTPVHVERPQKPKQAPIEKPVVENEDVEEDVEENAEYEEEENDEYEPFEKYFDRDNEDRYRDHENFEEDEDDSEEDNNRGSSRHYPKKYRKSKKSKYITSYRYPEEKYLRNDKYKSYKHKPAKKSKHSRSEQEARHSEPIPTTHKKKILREHWYLSKSSADRFDED